MIYQNIDTRFRKIFRDAVQVTFYRRSPDKTAKTLKNFFSDYYRVELISSPHAVPSDTDILNVLEEEAVDIPDFTGTIWVEKAGEKAFEKNKAWGPMRELYITLFMDHCSA